MRSNLLGSDFSLTVSLNNSKTHLGLRPRSCIPPLPGLVRLPPHTPTSNVDTNIKIFYSTLEEDKIYKQKRTFIQVWFQFFKFNINPAA